MPSWAIHLNIANKLVKELNIKEEEKNQFIFGNILPDINNGYVIRDISKIISHKETHFESKEYKGEYDKEHPNYMNFYNKYKNKMNNKVILGYYTHIMTDFYFNNTTYTKYGVFDKNSKRIGIKLNNEEELICDNEQARKMKVNDFKIYAEYIYQNNLVSYPQYDKDIVSKANEIKEISITENDELSILQYIERCINKEINIIFDDEIRKYRIFNQEKMNELTQQCIEFIIQKLASNK